MAKVWGLRPPWAACRETVRSLASVHRTRVGGAHGMGSVGRRGALRAAAPAGAG